MIITIDFESYYDKEFSLSKISEVDYILSPQFEVMMCSFKRGNGPTYNRVGFSEIAEELAMIEAEIGWANVAMLAHNTRFDGAILYWVFGYKPKLYLDTLSMARATTHSVIGRSSLEAVSKYFGLTEKGTTVVNMIGRRLSSLSHGELQEYIAYCNRDVDNCWDIFTRLKPVFTATELTVIDMIIRMFVEPQVKLNSGVLQNHLAAVQAEAAQVMQAASAVDKSVYSSNLKFASLLESLGVEVPMKVGSAGNLIPAVAKNDRAFKELCADESQPLAVQVACAARLSVKGTLEETRTDKLLGLARHRWHDGSTGWATVPLKYSGAHTHRFSGDGGTNWQNFKRGSQIREAVEAPPGYVIVHRDASQIEARMVAALACARALLEAFEMGRDVYSEFASIVYGRTITKEMKTFRFVGKTCILGLGYGMGWEKFRHTLFIGNGGQSVSIEEDEARRIVQVYRQTYDDIPKLWDAVFVLLHQLTVDKGIDVQLGRKHNEVSNAAQVLIRFPAVASSITLSRDALFLPSGLCIAYPNIRYDKLPDQFGGISNQLVYDGPYGEPRRMFGGKGVENLSQALSRIVITDSAVRVKQQTGFTPFLTTHDSLDYCVPRSEAEAFDALMEREFAIRPAWLPSLPLASEGGFGPTLLAAENEKDPRHNQ